MAYIDKKMKKGEFIFVGNSVMCNVDVYVLVLFTIMDVIVYFSITVMAALISIKIVGRWICYLETLTRNCCMIHLLVTRLVRMGEYIFKILYEDRRKMNELSWEI